MTFISGGNACMLVLFLCRPTLASADPDVHNHKQWLQVLPTRDECVSKLLRFFLPVLTCFTEVVLAVLLRSFRFMPSDQEVYWNLAGVNYPTVGKDGVKAALPLKLEPVKV